MPIVQSRRTPSNPEMMGRKGDSSTAGGAVGVLVEVGEEMGADWTVVDIIAIVVVAVNVVVVVVGHAVYG